MQWSCHAVSRCRQADSPSGPCDWQAAVAGPGAGGQETETRIDTTCRLRLNIYSGGYEGEGEKGVGGRRDVPKRTVRE